MEDLFKKFLYTGVGFVSMTAEKLQESIDELVGKGKISRDEGRKIIDDFMGSAESRKEEFEQKLKEAAENVLDKFAFVGKSEFEDLVKRVEELEKKASAKKTTTTRKKTSTRKSSTAKKKEDK